MRSTLYVLRSQTTGSYYTGVAHDLAIRVKQHNGLVENPNQWTRGRGPWQVAYAREFATVTAALRAERFVKRMKSRRFIEQLIRGEPGLDRFDTPPNSG